ncbi:DUF6376 family protein [Cytobacillus purgationiresistens]|uniref:Lipoprotein n=1 Tax=Cytobacillus purgationiresistens TaxID=863449 RepID=A0ABU0AA60_9BACI|nr:DUF6376 family protein [Cytobacillus purgationiresistens]MDQ0268137.1 hypothetical protein [Cytobacillus purgationiresistens]
MNRLLLLIPFFILLTTAACSPIEDTKDTLIYINGVEDYMNELSRFTEEFPSMAEEALSESQAAQELETRVQQVQEDIETFNQLDSPVIMEELHDELLKQNENMQQGLESLEIELEKGTLNIEFIEDSEILKSIQGIEGIYEQIEKLGE